ncbi:hypothetical protein J3R82DRAFT_7013 [Butyriboletus roseoflavus]|nr:hypothetical protein J3R82DRAFT_7013 [Butyriboletus roseoflavus]
MSPIVHSELRMIPLKPSLVIQSPVAASSYVQAERFKKPTSSYPHISFFRSLLLDMQIYSPSVKVVKLPALEISQPRPVFCDQDKIEGKIMLDPSFRNGRLTISLEGAFEYSDSPYDQYSHNPTIRKHRHVFLSSSATIPISTIPDSRSTIREALSRKRP